MSYVIWDQGHTLWDRTNRSQTLWDFVDQAESRVFHPPTPDWRLSSYVSRGDIWRLTVGCLNILAGTAIVEFPTSTRSHPSYFAVVSLTAAYPLRDGDRKYFPFQVPWHLWQQVIVPVLHPETLAEDFGLGFKDKFRTTLRNWRNMDALGLDDYLSLTDNIALVIATLMEVYGYLPPGTVGGTPEVPAETAPGEPVVQVPEVGDPNYPLPDGEPVWPEGHLRLTYPTA